MLRISQRLAIHHAKIKHKLRMLLSRRSLQHDEKVVAALLDVMEASKIVPENLQVSPAAIRFFGVRATPRTRVPCLTLLAGYDPGIATRIHL